MKKYSYIALILLLLPIFVYAGYYDNVLNLQGEQLKSALRTLISTNTNSNYDNAKLFMFQDADNFNGSVRCVYTGHVYNISSSYNGSSNPNTEHTYAQSWFSSNQSSIKKADVHHLFPTTMNVNSSRGNLPFAVVPNHSTADVYYANEPWQSYRGNDGSGHTVFEPADQSKGNVARALLYFTVRYNDGLIQGGVNMLSTLLAWHIQDPVDATELNRNQLVFQYQSNRNPFVDHPEFVARIWGPTSNDDDVAGITAPLSINRAYPNPFKSATTLGISASKSGFVMLRILNVRGQVIREESLDLRIGEQEYTWNGLDREGNEVSRGVYLIQAATDGFSETYRIMKMED